MQGRSEQHETSPIFESVDANLNYFTLPAAPAAPAAPVAPADEAPGGSGDRPAFCVYNATEAERELSPQIERHRVSVHNARLIEHLRLDVQGMEVVSCEPVAWDFYDADQVREAYYPEVEKLVRETTGASRLVAFDHNVRCAAKAKRGEGGAQMPVKSAHNDYTESSGPQRVRDLLPNEADVLLERRFAVINFWKPIRGPVQSTPLAVCDAQSIAPGDWMATDLKYRDRTGEVYALKFNSQHVWMYLPQMLCTEAMLIKCYDSEKDGRARFTAHTAFSDPTSAPDAPARESVEVRTLAFF